MKPGVRTLLHPWCGCLFPPACLCLVVLPPSQPFEFVAGERIIVTAKKANDSAGGLFAGGSGPKPPPALSTAVVGMRPGGRVRG
jgi:hypothetical protein